MVHWKLRFLFCSSSRSRTLQTLSSQACVLVCSGGYIKILRLEGLEHHALIAHSSGDGEVQKATVDSCLLSVSSDGGERKNSEPLHGTVNPIMGIHSYKSNYLPKAPSPYTITLGVRDTHIQSITRWLTPVPWFSASLRESSFHTSWPLLPSLFFLLLLTLLFSLFHQLVKLWKSCWPKTLDQAHFGHQKL